MSVFKELSEQNIKDIKRIEKIFKKLSNDGVQWEEIDGGGGGTAYFFKAQDGVDLFHLGKEFKGDDRMYRLINQIYEDVNESEDNFVYSSSIHIGISVP